MNKFEQIFKNVISEGNFGKDLSNISKGQFNMAHIILGSKNQLSKKDSQFQDDIEEMKDQYTEDLESEEYEVKKIGFKNGEFTILAIKYFDKYMPEKKMKEIVKKEISSDLKIVSLFGKINS